MNFVKGTATLAMNINRAISQSPARQNSRIPPRMVLSASPSNPLVCITGSRFAGM